MHDHPPHDVAPHSRSGAATRLLAGLVIAASLISPAAAQPLDNGKHGNRPDAFRQLEEWLPTPNQVRTGSGAPGPLYWQQTADYEIEATLDERRHRVQGSATIHYHNHSPMGLRYIWVQLDQNLFRPDSLANRSATAPGIGSRMALSALRGILARESFEGGYQISNLVDGAGEPLPHTVIDTMMRIDLPSELAAGESTTFKIDYAFNIVDATLIRARSGYETFEADGNTIYEMAQWFPRVVSYTDYTGWQHKQFIGAGEFTLELGDYLVRLTVPADHIVAATGVLQNPLEVLTEAQRDRLSQAATAEQPMFIVTPEEAKENEKEGTEETKTWVFEATNVRDFAFASSRKFIWDAQGHAVGDSQVTAMSYYPNEAEPLWSQYSTAAIIHTLNVYGRYTFAYPYPTAISVNGPVYGMEYPMICFNGPRPEADGTYTARTKYGLISVIIHEVGHNFFPMIVNSDERQWTWMDEGLNTFLQFLAEQEWETDYPSQRGEPAAIVGYMRGDNQMPIMTNSESILQFGNNAYAKPATALNILRETILGRELFDFAFKEYAQRWKFKRPTPADFFRTMEDASGVDLDWFWRGWFYSTEHVDIAIEDVKVYLIESGDPDARSERKRVERETREKSITAERNMTLPKLIDQHPGLKDFYNDYDELEVTEEDRKAFQKFVESLKDDEKKLIQRKTNFYVLDFSNQGGLVMPIILRLHYQDGSQEMLYVPAEIWRHDSRQVSKLVVTDKELTRVELDPRRQTADTDYSNNHWPPKIEPTRFELFKDGQGGDSPMRKAKQRAEKEKADKEKADKDQADKDQADKDQADKEALQPGDLKQPDAEKPSQSGALAEEPEMEEKGEPVEETKAPKLEPPATDTGEAAGEATAPDEEEAEESPANGVPGAAAVETGPTGGGA